MPTNRKRYQQEIKLFWQKNANFVKHFWKPIPLNFERRYNYNIHLYARRRQKRGQDGTFLTEYEEEVEMVTSKRDVALTPDRNTV